VSGTKPTNDTLGQERFEPGHRKHQPHRPKKDRLHRHLHLAISFSGPGSTLSWDWMTNLWYQACNAEARMKNRQFLLWSLRDYIGEPSHRMSRDEPT
jgi:hypothetical protein